MLLLTQINGQVVATRFEQCNEVSISLLINPDITNRYLSADQSEQLH